MTAADLNAEFNNPLNNPISLISPTTGAINFQTSVAHTNLTPTAITASSGTGGNALIATSSGASAQWGTPAAQSGSRVKNLSGTLSTQTGVFTARQYVLQTTNGLTHFVLNSTDSFTVNVGTAGPAVNGRDTAAVISSTFAHFYAITTGQGSTVAGGIASAVAPPTGPTMPTSYTAWAYLGASPYSSASTTLTLAYMQGSRTYLKGAFTDAVLLSGGTAAVATQVVVTTVIPASATHMHFITGVVQSTLAAGTVAQAFLGVDNTVASTAAMHLFSITAQVVSVDHRLIGPIATIPNIDRGLWYITATTALAAYIYAAGHTNANGDV